MSNAEIVFCDLKEAENRGWSLEALLHAMLALDRKCLPGIDVRHIGTPEQWAPIYQAFPGMWRAGFRRDGTLVAYWHFITMNETIRNQIVKEDLADADLDLSYCDTPNSSSHDHMLLTSFFIDQTAVSNRVFLQMLDSFFICVQDFARQGILYQSLMARPVSIPGFDLYRKLDMKPVAPGSSLMETTLLPPPARSRLKRYQNLYAQYQQASLRTYVIQPD